HPVIPARPSDAPITLRNPRRETESTHSEAPLGNSRCRASWKSSLPASSSSERQYSGPVFSAASCAVAWSIRARTEFRSSLPFWLGQTSSRFPFLLCSSIFDATACHNSFAPTGLVQIFVLRPTACAVGCILSPLRGWLHHTSGWLCRF